MGLFAVATLLLPAVAAVPLALDAPSAAGTVVLSTFDGNKATTQGWRATNDPVMGGISQSSAKVADGVLSWIGEVKVVPKLHAPGFCTATTGGYEQPPDKFPDISAAEGLLVTARNKMAGGLSSFKVSMETSVRSGHKQNREGEFEGRFNTHRLGGVQDVLRAVQRDEPELPRPARGRRSHQGAARCHHRPRLQPGWRCWQVRS
jgi:hypothetical protein